MYEEKTRMDLKKWGEGGSGDSKFGVRGRSVARGMQTAPYELYCNVIHVRY